MSIVNVIHLHKNITNFNKSGGNFTGTLLPAPSLTPPSHKHLHPPHTHTHPPIHTHTNSPTHPSTPRTHTLLTQWMSAKYLNSRKIYYSLTYTSLTHTRTRTRTHSHTPKNEFLKRIKFADNDSSLQC